MVTRETHPRPPGLPAFSLLEIVAVIAILSVLLVAGVRVLGDTGIQARKTSVDSLISLTEQARSAAITSRSTVLLAIAKPGSLPADDSLYRIGLFKLAADSEWPADGSAEITATLMRRWQTLSPRVILIGGAVDGIRNPLDEPSVQIRYGNRLIQAHVLAFTPRGGLQFPTGSDPVALRIAEGTYQNGIASPQRRGGQIAEHRLKVGRIIARPYRTDG